MQSDQHKQHLAERVAHNSCPECRADNSRRFAATNPFRYAFVREYLSWAKPRIEAIRGGNRSVDARVWHERFVDALNARISSHMPFRNGRKHAPDYAKYHMASYGNDFRYLNNL